jgi:hypothetical protein
VKRRQEELKRREELRQQQEVPCRCSSAGPQRVLGECHLYLHATVGTRATEAAATTATGRAAEEGRTEDAAVRGGAEEVSDTAFQHCAHWRPAHPLQRLTCSRSNEMLQRVLDEEERRATLKRSAPSPPLVASTTSPVTTPVPPSHPVPASAPVAATGSGLVSMPVSMPAQAQDRKPPEKKIKVEASVRLLLFLALFRSLIVLSLSLPPLPPSLPPSPYFFLCFLRWSLCRSPHRRTHSQSFPSRTPCHKCVLRSLPHIDI